MMQERSANRILIDGIVQGVGFRPFIYNLALRHKLHGWVRNTSGGVEIEVSGSSDELDQFIAAIRQEAPPLSRIDFLKTEAIPHTEYAEFSILQSQVREGAYQPISPDVCTCQDCLDELFSPDDFRYRYPFINCTNCGPRFTIIKDIPYDRPLTTMRDFELCPTCHDHYLDPSNRRFHAQPVACQICGPEIWLEFNTSPLRAASREEALIRCQALLAEGKIGAIKGLGGFHLACSAQDAGAIDTLRKRKDRPSKPLAVMMPDLNTVRNYCQCSPEEEQLLLSVQRPILLLNRKPDCGLPESIAPGQNTIGVMLPYTPLHYLLFSAESRYPDAPYSVLVMTSANYRGNPILTENHQVREDLGSIADFFLFHDRDIYIPCDDSVTRSVNGNYPIRRSRGYTPEPLPSPISSPPVFAAGAELKNTFSITREARIFTSQHMGDLKNYETLQAYESSAAHFESLFKIEPALLVHDLHPDYLSTKYVLERAERDALPTLAVQHHHAHIASCLADNQEDGNEPVIGLSFDGIGFGDDGRIWGGEFLSADYQSYTRHGHLAYFHLPGGDLAVREPWRCAVSILEQSQISLETDLPPVVYAQHLEQKLAGAAALDVVKKQLLTGTNAPLTSSLGRLFDAVSSLLGICHQISYEGQAAIELEALLDPGEKGTYPIEIDPDLIFHPGPLIEGIVNDLRQQTSPARISARFHNTLAEMSLQVSLRIREISSLKRIALSGGVWQNISLMKSTLTRLEQAGFEVLLHRNLPANDGGLSLGQAVIGQRYLSA